jgi:hypothetical protein
VLGRKIAKFNSGVINGCLITKVSRNDRPRDGPFEIDIPSPRSVLYPRPSPTAGNPSSKPLLHESIRRSLPKMTTSHLDRSAQAGHEAADRRSSRLLFAISIFGHESCIFSACRLCDMPSCWLHSKASVWHSRCHAHVQPQSMDNSKIPAILYL